MNFPAPKERLCKTLKIRFMLSEAEYAKLSEDQVTVMVEGSALSILAMTADSIARANEVVSHLGLRIEISED